MRRSKYTLPSVMAAFIVLAVVSTSSRPSRADDPSTPIQVHLALARDTVTLGEPILVTYTLTNPGSEALDIELGEARTGWVTSTVLDPSGTTLQRQSNLRPSDSLTSLTQRVDGDIRLEAGESLTGYFVAGQGCAVQESGQHTLQFAVNLPYFSADQELFEQGNVVLSVLVTDRDPVQLQATANSLVAQISGDSTIDMPSRKAAVDALCSMPQADVYPAWMSVATSDSVSEQVQGRLAYCLAGLGTAAAVDVLSTMAFAPTPDGSTGTFPAAMNTLSELYPVCQYDVSQQIEYSFTQALGYVPTEVTMGYPLVATPLPLPDVYYFPTASDPPPSVD